MKKCNPNDDRQRARTRRATPTTQPQRAPSRARRRDDSCRGREWLIDESLDASFPASDPPAWTCGGSVAEHRPDDGDPDAADLADLADPAGA